MSKYKIIEVKESIFASNEKDATSLREKLKREKCFLINVMSSPGSGKTTFLINLINRLKKSFNIGVMEADIDSDVDTSSIISSTGVKAIQIHTGGACHLTAQMTSDALNEFGINDLNLIFLENVGNLVCPAEFDTGSHFNLCLLSVPEGDDKPLKYPLMFEVSNAVCITKIDTLPYFDFDLKKVDKNIKCRNKNADIFYVSAKTDEGMELVANYISSKVKDFIL